MQLFREHEWIWGGGGEIIFIVATKANILLSLFLIPNKKLALHLSFQYTWNF